MESPPREVSLPAEAFDHLRTAAAHSDRGGGVEALHAAGYASGTSLYRLFTRSLSGAPESVGVTPFFEGLSACFRTRGWGTLTHESRHPGVAVLSSPDWAEADGAVERAETPAGCAFSTGVLSSLLTRAAGAPVAVLETSCRGRGDDRCTFAFGSEATIRQLYRTLLEGDSLDDALDALHPRREGHH